MVKKIIFLIICVAAYNLAQPAEDSPNRPTGDCTEPLGMESGAIPDKALNATSSHEPFSVGPNSARIRKDLKGGAWCPKYPISSKSREYLEINLNDTYLITWTETQGRFGNGQGQEFVEVFSIEYWRDSLNKWVVYKDHEGNELLTGNANTYTSMLQEITLPFVASKIRFVPYSVYVRTVCMRVEIYGCPWKEKVDITEYSINIPDQKMNDSNYDGVKNKTLISGGLGRLVDKQYGLINISGEDIYSSYSKGWVGWQTSDNNESIVEITFTFGGPRNFSSVTIHITHNNNFGVQEFRFLEVWSSLIEKEYRRDVYHENPHVNEVRHDRNSEFVMVPFRKSGLLANKIKIRFHITSQWFLLDEISFSSYSVNLTNEILLQYYRSSENRSPDFEQAVKGFLSFKLTLTSFLFLAILLVLSIAMALACRYSFIYKKHDQVAANIIIRGNGRGHGSGSASGSGSAISHSNNVSNSLSDVSTVMEEANIISALPQHYPYRNTSWININHNNINNGHGFRNVRAGNHLVENVYDKLDTQTSTTTSLTRTPTPRLNNRSEAFSSRNFENYLAQAASSNLSGGTISSRNFENHLAQAASSNHSGGTISSRNFENHLAQAASSNHSGGTISSRNFENHLAQAASSNHSGGTISSRNFENHLARAASTNHSGGTISSRNFENHLAQAASSNNSGVIISSRNLDNHSTPQFSTNSRIQNGVILQQQYLLDPLAIRPRIVSQEDLKTSFQKSCKKSDMSAGPSIHSQNTQNRCNGIPRNNLSSDASRSHDTQIRQAPLPYIGQFTRMKLSDAFFESSIQVPLPKYSHLKMKDILKLGRQGRGNVKICNAYILADGTVPSTSTAPSSTWRKVIVKSFFYRSHKRYCKEEEEKKFINECNVLSQINFPSINSPIGIYNKGNIFSVIHEYPPMGSVIEFLKSYPNCGRREDIDISSLYIVDFIKKIIDALVYMEDHRIVHRDIAARNCLLFPNYIIKLSDHSIYMDQYDKDYYYDKGSRTFIPLRWMSWECIVQEDYSPKSDIWAFGVLTWEMLNLCHEIPYNHMSNDDVFANCISNSSEFRLSPTLIDTECLSPIISLCMVHAGENRITARKLREYMINVDADGRRKF